jgi:NTP pyrophosphatase (non-canonical NTP hydrolase)
MDFSRMAERALEIRRHYETVEAAKYGRPWNVEELTLGFMGDVGDLAKLIMAHEGVRAIPEQQEKLEHELADCLWSIIVLAKNVRLTSNKRSTRRWMN